MSLITFKCLKHDLLLVVSPQLFANESISDHVGFARVFIEIINENDNRPIFSRPLYNLSIPENTPPGTSLVSVLVSIIGCSVSSAENVINNSHSEEKINWHPNRL